MSCDPAHPDMSECRLPPQRSLSALSQDSPPGFFSLLRPMKTLNDLEALDHQLDKRTKVSSLHHCLNGGMP
jgi:hypothetical protein